MRVSGENMENLEFKNLEKADELLEKLTEIINTPSLKEIMTEAELKKYFGIKDKRTIQEWETLGLEYCYISSRTKFYLREDILKFMRLIRGASGKKRVLEIKRKLKKAKNEKKEKSLLSKFE